MPISNPTAGDVHVNRPLTNFSQKYLQSEDAFIALKAMPNLPVSKQSDLYYIFNRGDFYRDEAAERADGTESAGSGFSLSTNPYFARVYAFHKDVTDRQRQNADPEVNLDNSAAQFVAHKMMIRRERLFMTSFFGASLWGSDYSGVTSAPGANQFIQWDQALSDPAKDVRAAMQIVQGRTGYRPNKMIIARQVWNQLLENDSITARISGGATTSQPAIVMRALIAQLFELENIFIADGVYNSAVPGATEATGFIAGKHALLYYAPDSVGLEEPSAGVNFSWTGPAGNTPNGWRVKRFRMENLEADRVEGQMSFDQKLTGSELGFFFGSAVA